MPRYCGGSEITSVIEYALGLAPITEAQPANFMTKLCKFQGQFPKPTETVVEEVLAHVLAFGEDENAQEKAPVTLN